MTFAPSGRETQNYQGGYEIGYHTGHSEGYLKSKVDTERDVLNALREALENGQTMQEFIDMMQKRVDELAQMIEPDANA